MGRLEDLQAAIQRKQLAAELEALRAGPQATPTATPPVGAPSGPPVAPQMPSPPALSGPRPPDSQFPVTIGKAAMPQTMNKIMEERGTPSLYRAAEHAMGVPEAERTGGFEKDSYGARADALIGKGVADLGHGIKQLTTGLDEGDVADVEAWRDLSAGAGMGEGEGMLNAGTVGDIAGNVGALAVPLGAAEQAAAKTMTALPKWASKVGAAMGVGGAEGFAQPVLEDDFFSRGANTAIGAALPGALSGTIQAGRKVITQPFKMSRAAESLEAEGAQLTLGQGVDESGIVGRLAKNIEDNLEGVLPGISGGRKRAEKEVADILAQRAVPPGAPTPQQAVGSSEYFMEMDGIFDASYKEVLDTIEGRIDVLPIMNAVTDALDSQGMMVNPSVKRSMQRQMTDMLDEAGGAAGLSVQNARKFQERIRKQLTKLASVENATENTAGGIEILSSINEAVTDIFADRLGPEMAEQLKQVDLSYAHKMLLETAAGYKRADPQHIAVQGLERAVRARTGRGRRVRGKGLGQDIVDPAFETMGAPKAPRWARAMSGVGATVAAGVAPAIAAVPLGAAMIGTRRGGARALFGLYAPQRQLKRAMEQVVEPKIGAATATIHDTED